jgi:hypothetical protein
LILPHRFLRFLKILLLLSGVLALIFSMLSLWPVIGKPWPGFFYSPFYTTNVFTDSSTPAWEAGLRPEDRVILAGNSRIDRLHAETEKVGNGNTLYLVYELGRQLAGIQVQVESLDFFRLAEKALPQYFAGLLAILLARGSLYPLFACISGIALIIAPNYFLAAGCGLESGFEISGCATIGKWSAFFYFPLWSLALGAGWLETGLRLIKSRRKRLWFSSVVGLLLVFDLSGYLYASMNTATWNNPDFIVWHSRVEFWVGWLGFSLLFAVFHFKSGSSTRKILPLLALALFIAGFIFSTVFNIGWPGFGPQWYALSLPLFIVSTRR